MALSEGSTIISLPERDADVLTAVRTTDWFISVSSTSSLSSSFDETVTTRSIRSDLPRPCILRARGDMGESDPSWYSSSETASVSQTDGVALGGVCPLEAVKSTRTLFTDS